MLNTVGMNSVTALNSTPSSRLKDKTESMPSCESDTQLIHRIVQGDQNAYDQLVYRHLDRIVAFVHRLTGSREDAEEIAQEVFLRAWQTAAQWEERGIAYSTWLHRVTLNACHDRWRRNQPAMETLDESLKCSDPLPEEQAMQQSQVALIGRAIQQLSERQRAAVILSHYQGMTNIEASVVLNTTVEAVESLLGRARRKLKSLLQQYRIETEV